MQKGPPFSRRRSPNRPSPYSIPISTSASRQPNSRNQSFPSNARYVNAIAPKGGEGRGEGGLSTEVTSIDLALKPAPPHPDLSRSSGARGIKEGRLRAGF